MTEDQLKLLTQSELETLLIDVCYEFHRRGWTEEDMMDEIRSTYPEDSEEESNDSE